MPPPSPQDRHLIVEAYAGYKGEGTPRAFTYFGVRYEVDTVLERWYTERHSVFRVRERNGRRSVLRYDQVRLAWELVMQEGSE